MNDIVGQNGGSMKIAAITMVYRDHWALSEWYRHYADRIGAEHLFIFAHGKDDHIASICPQANIMTIPRDDLSGFDRIRGEVMNGLHQGLSNLYDWVIRTDADELICTDPSVYPNFLDLFREHDDQDALFALGFDVVETETDAAIQPGVFKTRRHAGFTGHYSKTFATKGLPLALHGVRVPKRRLHSFEYCLPRGAYLAHLKYANAAALTEANIVRSQVANSGGKGLPGAAWSEADADAEKFLRDFASKAAVSWHDARDEAYHAITAEPVKLDGRRVIRSKSLRFQTRTILPDWFAK
jgi:hypothetical protein